MDFYTMPFFWAVISMLGFHGATLVVSGHRVGRRLAFTGLMLVLITVGRILLVTPLCPQPRFDLVEWNWILGGIFLLAALLIALPTIKVKWWRAPAAGMKLKTTGVYAVVRHPMYLSEILWPIGWSLLCGSYFGLALTPIWWLCLQFHVLIEEERLAGELGGEYIEYMQRVRSRIVPGFRV
ncbi:MAG: isoprenylcysteine carboxylmethyltransferase family protein, partial [bacterium]|nr:isoprenylcysteine carboxylmethyltransferase family protein [bacterium]